MCTITKKANAVWVLYLVHPRILSILSTSLAFVKFRHFGKNPRAFQALRFRRFLYCYWQPSVYSMASQVFRHLVQVPDPRSGSRVALWAFLAFLLMPPYCIGRGPFPDSCGTLWTSCESYGRLEYGIWFPKVICLSQGSAFAAYILNFTWAVRFWEGKPRECGLLFDEYFVQQFP